MFGADVLFSALHAVVFGDRQHVKSLKKLLDEPDAEQILAKLKSDYRNDYKFSWRYLDQLSQRIDEINNHNVFCPFAAKRNQLYLNLLSTVLVKVNLEGARVLDFGCGKDAPFSLAAILLANGASRAFAIDVVDADLPMACRALSRAATDMVVRPAEWRLSSRSAADIRARALAFDVFDVTPTTVMPALAAMGLTHSVGSLEACADLAPIDLVMSVSVLEHVMDLPAVVATFARVVRPGGYMCHTVDFSHHGTMFAAHEHQWQHLTDETLRYGVNRHRLSDMVRLFAAVGFDVEIERHIVVPPDAAVRASLLPQFRDASDDDLATLQATLVCRAPC